MVIQRVEVTISIIIICSDIVTLRLQVAVIEFDTCFVFVVRGPCWASNINRYSIGLRK